MVRTEPWPVRTGRTALSRAQVTAMATQCMFQEMGLWIDSVVDGEAGMSMLSGAATYDLILLDVNLPLMSGYALCSWRAPLLRPPQPQKFCA